MKTTTAANHSSKSSDILIPLVSPFLPLSLCFFGPFSFSKRQLFSIIFYNGAWYLGGTQYVRRFEN
jgi:hypothetical protein